MSEIKTLHKGQFLALYRDRHWEYVARINANGAAFILAITEQRELVLVEQHRIPLRAQTIELPAGVIGDEAEFAGEGIEAAALRELEEETGFRGEHAERLISAPTAPGLTSEVMHLIRVHGLKRVGAGGGVAGEDITVHLVPLAGIEAWLKSQEALGKWIDPRVYMGLWFAQRP
jgi:ADP-ribose pyrophosphatase